MGDTHGIATRIFRLAFLLTGDGPTAGRVTEMVLQRPGAFAAESLRLDRVTILECRRANPVKPSRGGRPSQAQQPDGASGSPASSGLDGLASLGGQAREAWILVRVFGHSLRDAARSMDCSRTAVRRHLRLADLGLAGHPVSPTAAAAAQIAPDPRDARLLSSLVTEIRTVVAAVSAPEVVLRRHERRRTVRRWGRLGLLLLGAAALVAGAGAISRLIASNRSSDPAPVMAPADGTAPSPAPESPDTEPAS